jgi:hypothetical protein
MKKVKSLFHNDAEINSSPIYADVPIDNNVNAKLTAFFK